MNIGSVRWPSRLALGLWVLIAVVNVPVVVLILNGPRWPLVLYQIGSLTYPGLGAFLAARRPRNPLGWLLLAAALVATYVGFAYAYGLYPAGQPTLPGAGTLVHTALALNDVPWAVATFVLLLFPDGRLPSRRWRPYAWLTVVSSDWVCGVVLATSEPTDYGTDFSALIAARYYGFDTPIGALTFAADRLFRLLLLLAPLALVARYRRAGAEERLQIKWVAITAPPLVLVGAGVAFPLLDDLLPSDWLHILNPLVVSAFTAAIVVAVLKYRLYDIDVIVNKALVYAALAGFVTALYVGIVVGLGQLIGARGRDLGLSVLATVAVAVAFHPVRDRLQRIANRLVYGQRATPYEVMADLARRLSGAYSVEEVLPRMAEAAARGVGAAQARVRVLMPGERERSVRWPEDAEVDSFDRELIVTHRGERVGEIAVAKLRGDRVTPAEDKLLADVAAQAGPALRNVALMVEREERLRDIAAQAEELRASRNRIVSAQDTERRRLERDLHDGAQQQLVSLAGQLRLAKRMTTKDAEGAARLLDALVVEADEALDGVRDLARGIFPPLLADQGLHAALDARISKYSPDAHLICAAELQRERLDPRVEANVYFCCIEALQNAAKHATGAPVQVTLETRGADLVFNVIDQGPGFDAETAMAGGGLQNMADRMAALGGDLLVESLPGSGTTVIGRVPLQAW